jgi:hypothetical protein
LQSTKKNAVILRSFYSLRQTPIATTIAKHQKKRCHPEFFLFPSTIAKPPPPNQRGIKRAKDLAKPRRYALGQEKSDPKKKAIVR